MELSPLTVEQLAQLVDSNYPPSRLFEILTQYEQQACLMSEEYSGNTQADGGDAGLLSLFYSSFFLVHLLTDQM